MKKNISLQANYPHNPSWLEINVFRSNLSNFIINKHHLIKKHQIYCLEKLISREIYNMQLILSTAQIDFEKDFHDPERKDICVTINTKLCLFQYLI